MESANSQIHIPVIRLFSCNLTNARAKKEKKKVYMNEPQSLIREWRRIGYNPAKCTHHRWHRTNADTSSKPIYTEMYVRQDASKSRKKYSAMAVHWIVYTLFNPSRRSKYRFLVAGTWPHTSSTTFLIIFIFFMLFCCENKKWRDRRHALISVENRDTTSGIIIIIQPTKTLHINTTTQQKYNIILWRRITTMAYDGWNIFAIVQTDRIYWH